MDTVDIINYSKTNKKYKYLLLLIDVFTRQAFVRSLKNKKYE